MSKIFISHSSANNAAALAIAEWLRENGWDEFFLDINPARGLAPGERWQEALKTAADRCEAVLFLISAAWRDSRWCQAEFLLAKQLGKTIFGVVIEAIPLDLLPTELTAEWQLCDLVAGSEQRVFHVQADPIVAPTAISFATLGLQKLRFGLQKAGLDPATFPWPPAEDPARAPYQGLKALDVEDAAIFFGREAAIVRGLDALRGLRERGIERMFVILGASGSGKSSFLRAGLWPRLARDDRHFLPLPVIRPDRAVLSGSTGLIASLEAALRQRKRSVTRAVIRNALETATGLDRLLSGLQASAMSTLATEALPPTIVLPIDQAEELFATDGQEEAQAFLTLLGHTLAPPAAEDGESIAARRRVLAVLAMRSDSHERLQTEPQLAQVKASLFDLRPLAMAEYKAVIEGPAARATLAGRKLRIDPELTAQLLDDAAGADALPLLAFTLERLLVEYGGDGDLRKEEYEALGGIRGAIAATIQASFAEPHREPVIPVAKAEQERLLRTAFIPWLARIDPDTEERKRRVARWEEIPSAAQALVERLISQRLLVRDRRRVEAGAEEVVVVEVAHEALLRQWTSLVTWLDADADRLKQLEVVQRAAEEWHKNDANEAWLVHSGLRLESALTLGQQPDFARRLEHAGSAYLTACQAREEHARAEREAERQRALDDAKRLAEESEKRRQAEEQRAQEAEARVKDRDAAAARLRRRAWILTGVAALAVVAAVASGIFYFRAKQQTRVATSRQLAAQALNELNDHLDLSLLLSVEALQTAMTVEARQSLFKALTHNPTIEAFLYRGSEPARRGAFGQDGEIVALADGKSIVVFNRSQPTHAQRITDIKGTTRFVVSNDGRWLAIGTNDGDIWLWDRVRSTALGKPVKISRTAVTNMTFHKTDNRLAAVSGSRLFFVNVSDSMGLQPTGEELDLKEALDRVDARPPQSLQDELITAFTLDGKTLAATYYYYVYNFMAGTDAGTIDSAGYDSIVLWDVWDQRRAIASLDTSGANISVLREIAISPNGKTLAVGRTSGSDLASADYVRVYDLGDAAIMHPVPISPWHSTAKSLSSSRMAFSQDGKTLVIGEDDGTMVVFDSTNREWSSRPNAIKGVTGPCYTIVANSGNESLLVGKGETYLLWNRSANNFKTPLAKGEDIPRSIVFGDNGSTVRVANARGIVHSWDVLTGNAQGESLQVIEKGQHGTVFFSRDGQTLAAMTTDRRNQKKILLSIWSIPKRTRLGQLPLTAAKPLGFTPDGKYVVVFSEGTVRLLNITNLEWFGQPMAVYDADLQAHPPHQEPSIAFMPNGTKMAVHVFNKEDLQIWDLKSQQRDPGTLLIGEKRDWKDAPLTISPDGYTIAVGRMLFDRTTKKHIPLQDIPGSVCNLTFSHDSALLAVSYKLDGVAFFDTPTGRGHAAQYGVRLWDVRSQQWIDSPMDNLPSAPCLLAFSPDNKVIAVAMESQHTREMLSDVVLWDISLSSWIQNAERHIVYNKIIYENK